MSECKTKTGDIWMLLMDYIGASFLAMIWFHSYTRMKGFIVISEWRVYRISGLFFIVAYESTIISKYKSAENKTQGTLPKIQCFQFLIQSDSEWISSYAQVTIVMKFKY